MMTRSRLWTALAASSLLAASLAGCATQDEPPSLPPVSSMQANIEGPSSAPDLAKNAAPDGTTVYTNFANAWVRVKVLQVYATGVILVPAVVIAAALTQHPTHQGATWVWSITALGATADLEVRIGLTGWDVDLYITNAQVNRFHWLEGNFAADLSSGYWLAHDPELPAGQDEVVEIDWTYRSESDRTLAFSNVNQSSPDLGDVLTFTVAGDAASLVFDDASNPDLVANISWSIASHAGSIQVPGYNGGALACWDSSFANSACP